MKVMIVAGRFLSRSFSGLPMPPTGAAYIAGALLKAGHTVSVLDVAATDQPMASLKRHLRDFCPDVIGVSITVVIGDIFDEKEKYQTSHVDERPKVKHLIETLKQNSDARIVIGGPGFNYFAREWLSYLDLDYGIRGENEGAFISFLKKLSANKDIYDVPGCAYFKQEVFHQVPRQIPEDLDTTALPAYNLFHSEKCAHQQVPPYGIFTKRGCVHRCTFCPYRSLEGRKYRLKSPRKVIEEIKHVKAFDRKATINFCDNSFNRPKTHAEAICREITKHRIEISWRTGSLKPIGVTSELCRLFKDSGCTHLGLSIESASKKVLRSMKRGYTVRNVHEALDCLCSSDIPFGINVMIGAPDESPETVQETLAVLDQYPTIPSVFVSIGLSIWTHHQELFGVALNDGQLANETAAFDGAYYISRELPQQYMDRLIATLKTKKNYTVQVNKPYADYPTKVSPS